MADAKKKSAVVTIRAKKTIALAPGQMGFADLLTPRAFGTDPAKFNLDYHMTPAALEANKLIVQAKCIDQFTAEVQEAAKENGGSVKEAITPEEWFANQLKDPKPTGRIQLPFIKLRSPGFRTDRNTGEMIPLFMVAWDAENNLLDLASLKLAQGTILQPIVYPNMFASKPSMWIPMPSLRLVGVRVLKAVQFGGGRGAPAPDLDDAAIKAVMGEDFDMQNLSAFALGSGSDGPAHDDHHDDDADPADLVKGMF